MTPQELLLAENYFKVPYDEAAMRTTILFVVGIFLSALALDEMSSRPKRKNQQGVLKFTPKAQLSAKDQVLLDMLGPLGA